MGKPTGFMEFGRELPRRRPVPVRLRDWHEVYEPFDTEAARHQGARCMDCGIPFCHEGCPLGNLIPEWNDLVWRDDWSTAIERLHATNNFPEFTGRLCPAPCEAACVLGINSDPVTIERIEYEIAERAWEEGWVTRQLPRERTAKRVAVVGSGPAGLACAQQLARAGHEVVVFERAEKPGGLLRYGIPEFKMEKRVLDRRLAQLVAEGVAFRCSTLVGLPPAEPANPLEPGLARGLGTANAPELDVVSAGSLREEFDAVVLAGGATVPRDLPVPGRHLRGVHFAMEYLKPANLVREGALSAPTIDAKDLHVIIIGGGDTGADCLGTVHRQGAASVVQLEITEEPPGVRPAETPWPTWPLILRTSAAHEEGGARHFAASTTELLDDGTGAVAALRAVEVRTVLEAGRMRFEPVDGSGFELPCQLVLLALGFSGAERHGALGELGVEVSATGGVSADDSWSTNLEGVFVCGDMTRGQSLIVWAIAEGRSAAAAVDRWLMGDSALPAPLRPGQLALR
jgi:glutamate synthase (NADPH/NADH) small chain